MKSHAYNLGQQAYLEGYTLEDNPYSGALHHREYYDLRAGFNNP